MWLETDASIRTNVGAEANIVRISWFLLVWEARLQSRLQTSAVFWCLKLRCPKKNTEPLVCLRPCILLSYALGVHALNPMSWSGFHLAIPPLTEQKETRHCWERSSLQSSKKCLRTSGISEPCETTGVIKLPIWGIKQCKFMVIFMDFPYNTVI